MKGKILASILVLVLLAIYFFLIRANTNNNITVLINNDSTLFVQKENIVDKENIVEKPKDWQLHNIELSCAPTNIFVSTDSAAQNIIASLNILRTGEEIEVLPESNKKEYIHTTGGFVAGDYFVCVKCEGNKIISGAKKISVNDGYGLKVELVVKQAFILDDNQIKNSFKAAISYWEQSVKMFIVDASQDISSKPNARSETIATYAAMLAGDSITQAISKYYALESTNPAFAIINAISKSYAKDLIEKVSINSFRTILCRSIDAAGKDIKAIDEAYLQFITKYKIYAASKLTYQDIDVLIAKCIANDFPTGKIISIYLVLNLIDANEKFGGM